MKINNIVKFVAAMVHLLGTTKAGVAPFDDFISAYQAIARERKATTAPADTHMTNLTMVHAAQADDKVPLGDLPQCYRTCIDKNCCNASELRYCLTFLLPGDLLQILP